MVQVEKQGDLVIFKFYAATAAAAAAAAAAAFGWIGYDRNDS